MPEIFYEALLKSFRELVSLNLMVELQPKNCMNDKLYKEIIGEYHTCDLIKKTMKMNGEAMGNFFSQSLKEKEFSPQFKRSDALRPFK